MNFNQFFKELKRRSVYKVAVTYAVVAWLVAQIAGLGASSYGAPEWVMKMILLVLVVGFPIALILAWAFEMSPQGIIRTTSVAAQENPFPASKKKPLTSNLLIGFLLLVIAGQFIYTKYWQTDGVDTADIEKSIAVLPFKNESANQENQYFCNGMMEAILNHLSKIQDLRVISRTSVEQYRENLPTSKQIGEELDVIYLLEGSVQRYEDKALIFAQLIEAETDKHLWSQSYDRDLSDIFSVQAEITKIIADELKAKISPEVEDRIDKKITNDPIAYDYYLQGEEFLTELYDSFTAPLAVRQDLIDKAELFYQQALERDSLLAEAIVGLSRIDLERTRWSEFTEEDYLENSLSLANEAIAVNEAVWHGQYCWHPWLPPAYRWEKCNLSNTPGVFGIPSRL